MDASLIVEMKNMAEQNRCLKKLYAEMSMLNDLLEEALGKKRYGRLYDESGHECGHRARYQHRADLEDVSDQRDLLSLQHYSERWERRDY